MCNSMADVPEIINAALHLQYRPQARLSRSGAYQWHVAAAAAAEQVDAAGTDTPEAPKQPTLGCQHVVMPT
jgi:hypothetical protein